MSLVIIVSCWYICVCMNISNAGIMVRLSLGCILWLINPCRLFNAKTYLHTHTHTHTRTHTYIYIYMHIYIILSCHQYGYPRTSLATPPYRSLLLTGTQGYIPYLHITAVCRFLLFMSEGPQEYITYELVPAFPAVPCMSGSSSFDSFRDER